MEAAWAHEAARLAHHRRRIDAADIVGVAAAREQGKNLVAHSQAADAVAHRSNHAGRPRGSEDLGHVWRDGRLATALDAIEAVDGGRAYLDANLASGRRWRRRHSL